MIDAKQLDINLKGLAIGNGIMSEYLQGNSLMALLYGRGFTGYDEWNNMKAACALDQPNSPSPIYFNYSAPDVNSTCGQYFNQAMYSFYEQVGQYLDPYNIYQDCYLSPNMSPNQRSLGELFDSEGRFTIRKLARLAQRNKVKASMSQNDAMKFTNNYEKSWYGSTDPYWGFPCYQDSALRTYLNR